MRRVRRVLAVPVLGCWLALGACQSGGGEPGSGQAEAYDGIAEDEIIFLTGTEPFWGGEINNDEARYSTPENPDATPFEVERFAGNSGLAFTGRTQGNSFDLMITPGECSDAMSDRTYPFVATLRIGDEQRNGCAWTEARPFTGDRMP